MISFPDIIEEFVGKIVQDDILGPAIEDIVDNEEAKKVPPPAPVWERSEVESLLEPLVLDCIDQAADEGEKLVTNNMIRSVRIITVETPQFAPLFRTNNFLLFFPQGDSGRRD